MSLPLSPHALATTLAVLEGKGFDLEGDGVLLEFCKGGQAWEDAQARVIRQHRALERRARYGEGARHLDNWPAMNCGARDRERTFVRTPLRNTSLSKSVPSTS